MGCCIALALIISVLRTAWFRLVRRQVPERVGFAPPARRQAPGAVVGGQIEPASHPAETIPTPRGRGLILVLPVVIGAGLYAEVLALLVHSGALTVDVDPVTWRIRLVTLIGGAAVAALAAAALRLHRPEPAERQRRLALTLAGAGGAWSLLSVLDMHVTGLVPEHLVTPLADLALHGPGFLAATVGVGALLAGDRWLSTLSPRGSS